MIYIFRSLHASIPTVDDHTVKVQKHKQSNVALVLVRVIVLEQTPSHRNSGHKPSCHPPITHWPWLQPNPFLSRIFPSFEVRTG